MGIHGSLDHTQRADFLSREQTTLILKYSEEDIVECTRLYKQLREIEEALRWRVKEISGKRSSAATQDPKDHSRGGKSNLSGSVWSAPVNRDEAIQATVEFDKKNRPEYL